MELHILPTELISGIYIEIFVTLFSIKR